MAACSASHGGFILGCVRKCGRGIAGCGTTITLGKLPYSMGCKAESWLQEKNGIIFLRLCVTGPRSVVVALLLLSCIRLGKMLALMSCQVPAEL